MELSHCFTVPVDRDAAWAAFQDIAVVAACFPGATVTSAEGDAFEGTVTVQLGPMALQYAGGGRYVERDESAYRLVLEARGRDRRGNGGAGADVTATFTSDGPGTRIEVLTALQITGTPAQLGRDVVQEVSDRLLVEFLGCLASRIAPSGPAVAVEGSAVPPTSVAAAEPRVASHPVDEAVDLRTTVLPALAKASWKPIAILLLVLLLVLGWRARRR